MDAEELWLGVRRGLEDVGISPQLLSEKKDFIVSWIKAAIAEDLRLPKLTHPRQQDHTLGRAPSSTTVSPEVSPTTLSKKRSSLRLLSATAVSGQDLTRRRNVC
jgi:hypothetical protein